MKFINWLRRRRNRPIFGDLWFDWNSWHTYVYDGKEWKRQDYVAVDNRVIVRTVELYELGVVRLEDLITQITADKNSGLL